MNAKEKDEPVVVEKSAEVASQKPIEVHGAPENISFKEIGDQIRASAEEALKNLDAIETASVADVKDHVDEIAQTEMGEAKEHAKSAVQKNVPAWMPSFDDVQVSDQKTAVIKASGNPVAWAPMTKPTEDFPKGSTELDPVTAQKIKDALEGKPVMSNEVPIVSPESKIDKGPFGLVSFEEVDAKGGTEQLSNEAHKAVEKTVQDIDALIDAKIKSPISEDQMPFLEEVQQQAEVGPDEQAMQAAIDDLEAQIATKAAQAQLASNDNDMDKWSTILQEASVLHKQLDKKKEEMYALKREAWINNPATELTPVTSLTTEWQTGNERKVVELPPEDYGVVVKALENKMAEQVEAAPEQHNEDMVLVKKMQQLASDRGELTADVKEALQKEIGQKMNERVDGVLWQVIDEVNKNRPEGEKLSYDKTRDDFTGITKKAFLEAHAARKASLQDDIMVLKTYAENRSKDDPAFDNSEERQRLMKHLDRLCADQVAYESINLNDLSISPSEVYKQASAGTEKVAPAANTAGEVAPLAEEEEAVFTTKFAPITERGNDPVPPTPLNEAGVMSPLDFLNNVDTSKAALYQNFPPQKKEGAAGDEVLQYVPTGNTVQPAAYQTIGGTFRPGALKPAEIPTAMPTEPLPGAGSTQLDAATQAKMDAALNQTNAMRFKEQQAAEAADKDAILEAEDRISWKVDQQLKASADMASIKSTENMTNAQKFAHEKEEAEKEGERTAAWQRQQAFNRKIEDIRNQAKTETDPEKRRALWGQIDNEIRVWEAAKPPKESVETLAANPAEEPIRRSAQIRQEAIMNPNLTKDQFDAAMQLAAEEEAKENAAAAVVATATAATVVPATPAVVETAVVENPVATEPVIPSTEPVPAGIPATEIPAPQPNIFEEEEAELRNQENRERYENMLAQPRKDLVDADISLREWFTGKDKFSPYKGKINSLKNTWRSWTKSDKEYPDMVKVNGLVDAAMQKLIAQEKNTTLTDAQKKSLDTIINELKETSEFSGIQALDPKWDKTLGASMTRIKTAVEAKKKYTLARGTVMKEMMAAKVGALDVHAPEFAGKLKEVNKEAFEQLVLNEYDAQTKLREEKLNGGPAKAAGIFRKGWDKYKNLKWYTKMGIGVVILPAAVGVGTYAAGAGLAAAGIGAAGMMATRAVRAGLGMLGARIGSYVGGGSYEALANWRAGSSARKEGRAATMEELQANVDSKEWGADRTTGPEKEAMEFLAQSYAQYAKIEATKQKISRRKNIAKVLGGVAGGVGTATLGYNLAAPGFNALKNGVMGEVPEDGTVKVNDPTMSELKNADGTQPGSRVEASSNMEGYHVTKGQGIWHGVKQQMKDYITAGKVKPEDLGLKTQEQLDALKVDLADGKLDAANVRLLDRAIARSINANHMMSMGIKNIGETVTWKPNSTGGQIEFGSGDKALYQMGGKGSVVEHASQTSTSGVGTHEPILVPGDESKLTQSAEQIAAAKKAIAEQTGMSGTGATTAEAVATTERATTIPTETHWYDQLSSNQRVRAEALLGEFKTQYGVDLNNDAATLNQISAADVYKAVREWPEGGTALRVPNEQGVIELVPLSPELRKAILALPPTQGEADMNFNDFMRIKVAMKGSIDFIPKVEPVVITPKAEPTPLSTPKVEPTPTVAPTIEPSPTPTVPQGFERPEITRPTVIQQPTNVVKPINFEQSPIDQPPVPPINQ